MLTDEQSKSLKKQIIHHIEESFPEDKKEFLTLNKRLANQWPTITKMKPAPEDADQWKDVQDKLQYLEE